MEFTPIYLINVHLNHYESPIFIPILYGCINWIGLRIIDQEVLSKISWSYSITIQSNSSPILGNNV